MPMKMDSETMSDIVERVWDGKVTKDDALFLAAMDVHKLSHLADRLRAAAAGDIVTHVVNRNVNFTNLCINDCAFCAFRSDSGYVLSTEQILQKVEEAVDSGATEICAQGGLRRGATLDYYCEMLESIKSQFRVHVHALSPMEVYHAAENSNMDVRDALKSLKRSGLDSMPGTAAEILDDRVRQKICPHKISTAQWVEVISTAHKTGIPTTATMLYGHIETREDRINHLLLIRDLQQKTHGFTEFIPLPFMAKNNHLGKIAHGPTEIESLEVHALSRILLHRHIKNIQASWVKLGRRLAREILFCGANDLGGTLMEENISKSAGGVEGEHMSPGEFEKLITSAGRIPRRRTTLYEIY